MQNLKYTANGGIYLEYEHPVYGLIPTCAHPNDPATASLYAEALARGGIAPRDLYPNPRILQIKLELSALDTKKIRSIAEGDTIYLATLNTQTALLRAELATLPALV